MSIPHSFVMEHRTMNSLYIFSFHHRNKGTTNLNSCHEPGEQGCVEWLIVRSGPSKLPSTVRQRDETIIPAAKVSCHDSRSSALRCCTQRERLALPTSTLTCSHSVSRKHFPSLNTSCDLISCWISQKHGSTDPNIHTQPIMISGLDPVQAPFLSANGRRVWKGQNRAMTLKVCMYGIYVEEEAEWEGGTYV